MVILSIRHPSVCLSIHLSVRHTRGLGHVIKLFYHEQADPTSPWKMTIIHAHAAKNNQLRLLIQLYVALRYAMQRNFINNRNWSFFTACACIIVIFYEEVKKCISCYSCSYLLTYLQNKSVGVQIYVNSFDFFNSSGLHWSINQSITL